ncbi:MAG: histidine kinase [Solirubrobacteraceae bacterium]
MRAELASRLLPARVDQAATEVEQIRELTRSALEQVREAVGGYRRPTLPSELAGARVAFEAAGIELQVEAPDDPLDPTSTRCWRGPCARGRRTRSATAAPAGPRSPCVGDR